MKRLTEKTRTVVRSCIIENITTFREIKYFHPNGKTMPNGSHYQRGGFLHECKMNKDSFILDESVHGGQYGMTRYRGGIIVFPTDVDAIQLNTNEVLNKIKQIISTHKNRINRSGIVHNTSNQFNHQNREDIVAYSVGYFFKGTYVGDNGVTFNDTSMSIAIDGLSSLSFLKLAELVAKSLKQETVLVKDLNLNKIYLADSLDSDIGFDQEMERINTEC